MKLSFEVFSIVKEHTRLCHGIGIQTFLVFLGFPDLLLVYVYIYLYGAQHSCDCPFLIN